MSKEQPNKSSSAAGEKTGAKSATSNKTDTIFSINKRNRDLETRNVKMLGVTVTLALTLIASVAANVYMGVRPPPEPRYLVQQNDGTLIPVVPLNKPITNQAAIIQTVTEAITAVHALDFKNYKSQLSQASGYFTPNGWKKYLAELEISGTFEAIERRQLVLSSTVNRPPVITKEYEIAGLRAWDVEIPYMVQYVGAGFSSTAQLVATVTMVRTPITDNPRGIAIAGFQVGRTLEKR